MLIDATGDVRFSYTSRAYCISVFLFFPPRHELTILLILFCDDNPGHHVLCLFCVFLLDACYKLILPQPHRQWIWFSRENFNSKWDCQRGYQLYSIRLPNTIFFSVSNWPFVKRFLSDIALKTMAALLMNCNEQFGGIKQSKAAFVNAKLEIVDPTLVERRGIWQLGGTYAN